MISNRLNDLLFSYGERFLQELLGLGDQKPSELSFESVPSEIMAELAEVPRVLGTESALLRIIDHFFRHKSPYQTDELRFWEIRRLLGGDPPESSSEDSDLIELFGTAISMSWPALLLLDSKHIELAQSPALHLLAFPVSFPDDRLLWAMLEDEGLQRLFPEAAILSTQSPMMATQSEWWTSSGFIGCMNIHYLAKQIVSLAAIRVLNTSDRFSAATLLISIGNVIDQYRTFGVTHKIALPAVVGLAGVDLGDTQALALTSDVALRKSTTLDAHVLGILGQTPTVLDLDLTIELIKKTPISERNTQDGVRDEYRPSRFALDSLGEVIHRVRFSSLMASFESSGSSKGALLETFSQVSSPALLFSTGRHAASPLLQRFPEEVSFTTTESQQRLVTWYSLADDPTLQKIPIAARRMLSAADLNAMVEDRIVDAAIAFESLFATQKSSVARIRHAVAWLLNPGERDGSERLSVGISVSELFQARHSIVHADDKGKFTNDMLKERLSAGMDVLLRVTAALLKHHPELLDVTGSNNRTRTVFEAANVKAQVDSCIASKAPSRDCQKRTIVELPVECSVCFSEEEISVQTLNRPSSNS